MVANGHADHGATVRGRGTDLVGRLEVRVEPPVGVDTGVENEAKIERMAQDAIKEFPAELRELFFALFVPEQVGLAFGDGDVGVHTAAVDSNHRLGQEAGSVAHIGGNLAAKQLVELDLVGRSDYFRVAVVDLELAGRYLDRKS